MNYSVRLSDTRGDSCPASELSVGDIGEIVSYYHPCKGHIVFMVEIDTGRQLVSLTDPKRCWVVRNLGSLLDMRIRKLRRGEVVILEVKEEGEFK